MSDWVKPPEGTIRESVIGDVVGYEVEKPLGHVVVELRDERGRLTHYEAKDNFISRVWAYAVRSQQRLWLTQFPYNYAQTQGCDVPVPDVVGRQTWHYPSNWIAAWNDSSTEDPTNEHRIRTDGQGIVAYACRLPFSSPTQRRGQVNITDSVWTAAGESMVYDWSTTTGNGTFQSVGYTAFLTGGRTNGPLLIRPSFIDRRYGYYSLTQPLISSVGSPWHFQASGYGFTQAQYATDASDNLLITCAIQFGNGLIVAVIPPAVWRDGHTPDFFGGSSLLINPTKLTLTGLGSIANSGSYEYSSFLGESGGSYWYVVAMSSQRPTLYRVNKSTGAADQATQLPTGQGVAGWGGVGCIIAGKIYVLPYNVNNPLLNRYAVGTPPTFEATTTMAYPSDWTAGSLVSAATDGTDIWVWHGNAGLARFGTDGSLKEYIGSMQASSGVESSGAPYAGSYSNRLIEGLPMMDDTLLYRPYPGGSGYDYNTANWSGNLVYLRTPINASGFNAFGTNVFFSASGGEPWVTMGIANVGYWYAISKVGWNLGSRVKLTSPVVKDSSKTMKITYAITLPGFLS